MDSEAEVRNRKDGKNPEAVLMGMKGGLAARGKSGRKRSDAPRCPCEENTLTRAQMRKFDCCRRAGISAELLKGSAE